MLINPSEYIEKCLKIEMMQEVHDLLNKQAIIITFPKGHHPVREGEKMDAFYFLIYGLVRGYYIDEEGNDVTKCFSYENQFFSSECFRTSKTSSFFIECLEECKCIKLPYAIVKNIISLNEELSTNINDLYFVEIGRLESRAKNLLLMNAEERYINFCREYPNLQHRVPLKYIASHIGIKAGSMSRIRKKLKSRL